MKAYVNTQKLKSIVKIIHHTMVASKIFLPDTKLGSKPHEKRDRSQSGEKVTHDSRPKDRMQKEKGIYKERKHLSPEEMEQYFKENRCYKCGK